MTPPCWRGRGVTQQGVEQDRESLPASVGGEWELGALPDLGAPRPLPAGAVIQRLGSSGIRLGPDDLTVVLRRAYAAFTRR